MAKEISEGNKKFSKGSGNFNKEKGNFNKPNKFSKFNKEKGGYKNDSGKPDAGNSGIKFVQGGEKRRQPVDANTKNMRRLYNKLMQKSPKKEINKVDLVNKLMKTVNGNYSELCFKHDGCRVLQGSIKYGDKRQRAEIIKALVPHVYDLVIKKYSIYLAIKMFKFAEPKQRETIISQSVLPNFSKLMKSANGQMFLNFAYDNSTPSSQRALVAYYINKYLKISEERLKGMVDAVKGPADQVGSDPTDPANDVIINEKTGTYDGENVRAEIKIHLEKQLEKGVHKSFLFQAFLNHIFDCFDAKTKAYVSELFDDDLTDFLQNKAGVELACRVFTVASAKTRKKIVKKMKDHLKSIISNDTSVLFLIKVILFNDDTKLVEKYILAFLNDEMNEELMQNKNIFKVLMNIVTPFNPRVNNPHENGILSYKLDSASKKDENKRWSETISLMLKDIFNAINPNVKFFLGDATYSALLIEVVNLLASEDHTLAVNNKSEMLKELLNNVYSTVNIDYQNNFDDLSSTLLAEKTSHFNINRIVKAAGKAAHLDFLMNVWGVIKKNLEGYLDTKAVFIIVTILEAVKGKNTGVENDLKKFANLIKAKASEKEMIGYGLLNKILNC